MPAVSKAQQHFMGMVHAAQKGEEPASPEVAKVAKSIEPKAAKDYASTSTKNLPDHKLKEAIRKIYREYLRECSMTESLNEDVSDIKTPIYFKSKKGVSGFDTDTTFFVKDMPDYGNVKVYHYRGRLEQFIWFEKDKLIRQFKSGDFYKVDKNEYKPNN